MKKVAVVVSRRSGWWRVPGAVLLVPVVLAGCSGGPEPGVTASRPTSPVTSGSPGNTPAQPTGVGSSGPRESSPPGAWDVGGVVTYAEDLLGAWQLIELDGADMSGARDHGRYPLMVRFLRSAQADDWLLWSATDGCNIHGGWFTVTADGTFRAEEGPAEGVGCVPPQGGEVVRWPRSPEVVLEADRAQMIPATGGTAMVTDRLVLSRDGRALAVYVRSQFDAG